MSSGNNAYRLLAVICMTFIAYSLANNYVLDPGRDDFLSYKVDLPRELNRTAWLAAMYVHVGFACLAMASGLVNFSARLLQKRRKLHRMNGYVYLVSVVAIIVTSGYMAPYATGGRLSSIGFNLMNLIWLYITLMAFLHIKRQRVAQHRRWMIRSYAFCFNNLVIHLVTFVVHDGLGVVYPTAYSIGVFGSILTLLAVPHLFVRRSISPSG